ncbi:TetR/AcrR family transcriptional regulator [Peribacillus alkalitolerans]|uniref:TetR/AcrR family transcriptional regulator n=1 Tax=Peribacillus alkalitolerans TaxID=1550385 RepID=UPI0013D7B841|nr:TetR family transcriptional regulator [Peribacillus alkalitolerans]
MAPVVSEQHREERKMLILDAAREVFIKKGFNAVSMQDIIEHSGVSRGGVYTYFQNTEDIFLEILRKRDIEEVWGFDSLYQVGRTSWQVLSLILDQIMDTIENERDHLVPVVYEYYFTVGRKSQKHIPDLEIRVGNILKNLSFILNNGVESGEFKASTSVNATARLITTFCDGINVHRFHLGPDKIQLKNQFQLFKTYLKGCLLETDLG